MEEKVDFNFAKEDTLTDIALIVEDKKLYTSKALLSMASPVFERMFFSDKHDKDNKDQKGNPKEPDPQAKKYEEIRHLLCVIPPRLGRNNSKTLDLHDKKYDDIRDLLCVIHPRVGRHVTGKYIRIIKKKYKIILNLTIGSSFAKNLN